MEAGREAAGHRSGFAAVVGRPNVGKSTFINRMVGRKISIVGEAPQTTRRQLLGVTHGEDWQLVWVDTPGIHRPLHRLGEQMVRIAFAALTDVDAILLMVDLSSPAPGPGDRFIFARLEPRPTPLFLVMNKRDLVPDAELDRRVAAYRSLGDVAAIHVISASRGDGCRELLAALVALLPEGPRYFPDGELTDQPAQFLAAEAVREAVIAHTRDELPHAVAVVVEQYAERPGGMLYIAATLYGERESQKGILIGRGGEMLRRIGTAARTSLEALLERSIYLDLHVKVRENWRKRDPSLREFGYVPPGS